MRMHEQRLGNIVRGDISEIEDAIRETLPLIATMRRLMEKAKGHRKALNKSYELEARLGVVQGIDGMGEARARFENGVSRSFMDRFVCTNTHTQKNPHSLAIDTPVTVLFHDPCCQYV
jgi:hypothetical protein